MPNRFRSPSAAPVSVAVAVTITLAVAGCSRTLRQVQLPGGTPASVAELWTEPADLETRDLFYGAGGAGRAPRDTSFAFVAKDRTGFSPGYDVRGADGTEWSVKLGSEAQTEVVSSRILWAIGFHQPPLYYVARWTLTGQEAGPKEAGRFRPDLPEHDVVGDWSWYENPFVGTREFGGLIVANLILNNWDWKTSNNKIYRVSPSGKPAQRLFVVRDLGASLGKTMYPAILKWLRLRGFGQGTRNDLPGFEAQGFITGVDGQRVEFDYRGVHPTLVESVTPGHVRWTCGLMARLSDRQWRDAFRASGYDAGQSERYVRKIKAKVAQGLAIGR
jgi:hypothetical protein